MRLQSARAVRENGALSAWPALFTRMSMRGKRSRIFTKALCTDSGSVMSAGATSASAESSAACFSSFAASRPISATPAPWRDSAAAMAAPIPRPAPVTTATLPANGKLIRASEGGKRKVAGDDQVQYMDGTNCTVNAELLEDAREHRHRPPRGGFLNHFSLQIERLPDSNPPRRCGTRESLDVIGATLQGSRAITH